MNRRLGRRLRDDERGWGRHGRRDGKRRLGNFRPQAGRNAHRATKVREDADWRETVSLHPVLRTHPETGRKLLNVNAAYTVGFEGMTEAESQPLLDYLLAHGHRPEFTCRFRWENGSVAFWDNRAVKHLAIHDAGPHLRLMRRIQIAGDRPYE